MAARQKILILDDEQDILEIYQEILARLPSQPEIHTSDSGSQAIALLGSEPFHLLLVDLRMPQMDGFQVLAIVRRKFPGLRVVVMTAATDEELRARAYALGIDLYLEKPKTGKEIVNFVDCIESMLEKEGSGGFRGMQSKTLIDIIQLECLTKNSAVLKIASPEGEGTIWIHQGDVIDATSGDRNGKEAFLDMLRRKTGSFEILPSVLPRPRTIFCSSESLLMESAQALDEADSLPPSQQDSHPLAPLARHQGVQFVLSVETAPPHSVSHTGVENSQLLANWITETATAFASLETSLHTGPLEHIEALGTHRHLAVLTRDHAHLGVGFTRSATLPDLRETIQLISKQWAS